MFVVFVAGCGGGGSGDQAVAPTSPFATTYYELTAVPGAMVGVRVNEVAMLDGSLSSTTSTEPMSYSWSFSHKPDASLAVLQGATTAEPSFIADVPGIYMVELLVSAGGDTSQRAVSMVVATVAPQSLLGRFRGHQGMSSNCGNCHNGENLNGTGKFLPHKVPDHLATSNMCQACHTPQNFAIIPFIDHQEVFGNCSECHNNVVAIGMSEFHTPTDAECDDCHNTTSFIELAADGSFDHSNITRACAGCHNGKVATGMTPTTADTPPGTHPVTNSECGYCHTTISFLDPYPDHTGPDVVGPGITCDSCHGAGTAQGQSVGHPVTNVDCDTCHSVLTFKMPGGIFNHRLIDATVQRCDSCHNASTSINAIAAPDTITHQGITTDCGLCHNTDSFADGIFDHTGIADNCATSGCHTGLPGDASGQHSTHMATTEDCSVCHAPGTFTSGTYDHAGITSGCNTCHDNTISVGKLPNHIPTSPDTQDCAVCHNTTDFAGATFDHTSTDTSNCLACHDGNISIGKSVGHVATDLNCSSCHATSTYNSFAGTFVHSQQIIVGGDCASCHSTGIAPPKKVNHIPAQVECSACHRDTNTGGFVLTTFLDPTGEHQKLNSGCEGCHISRFIANPFALKAPGHLPTGQDCDACHTNNAFNPSIFNHSGISDNCASCHDGNVNHVSAGARGATNTALHRSTTQDCGECHNTDNFADAFVDHTGPEVVGKRCDTCHDGGACGAIGKHTGHVVTNEDCSACHVPGTFANAVFNHTGIVNNCASCHDGVTATGKNAKTNPAHVPTSQDCSVCHTPTAFVDARFDHQGIVDNCASCHNGATARGKMPPPDHVPTNGDCSNCHQTTGFIPATFNHVGIVDNCSSCHDGAFATGKSGNHIPTSQDCGICHTSRLPLSFIGAVFDHTGIVNNCASCHDGSTAIGKAAKTNPAHLATNLDCSSCHTTATFIGGTWVHDSSTANNCDQCHKSGGGATAKPNGHLSTNEQCDVCHTTNGWAPTDFRHSAQGNYPGDHRIDPGCTGCHKGSIGGGINSDNYPNQLRYAPACAGCHAGDFESEGDHNGGNNGTIEQNKNCGASGCHRVNSSGF